MVRIECKYLEEERAGGGHVELFHGRIGLLQEGRYFFDLTMENTGALRLVSREPERAPPDSSDSTASDGVTEVVPQDPVELGVSFDLPEGVSVSDVIPSRFHIVVEERNSSQEEDGLLLPAS